VVTTASNRTLPFTAKSRFLNCLL